MKTNSIDILGTAAAIVAVAAMLAPIAALAADPRGSRLRSADWQRAMKAAIPTTALLAPDLSVEPDGNPAVWPTTIEKGAIINVMVAVTNKGKVDLADTGQFSDMPVISFYLRKVGDPIIGNPPATTGMIIWTEGIPGGIKLYSGKGMNTKMTIPANIEKGDWNVEARVDPDGKIAETSESNNWTIVGTIKIVKPGSISSNSALPGMGGAPVAMPSPVVPARKVRLNTPAVFVMPSSPVRVTPSSGIVRGFPAPVRTAVPARGFTPTMNRPVTTAPPATVAPSTMELRGKGRTDNPQVPAVRTFGRR